MVFQGLVDKRNIWLLFGSYCNNPKYILDSETGTSINDYSDKFHKIVFGALNNIARKSKINRITPIEIENELTLFPLSVDIWNLNNGFDYIDSGMKETIDKVHNIGLYRDNVRKYSILRNAKEELKLDISFIYEEYNELDTSDKNLKDKIKKMEMFQTMKSKDVIGAITDKILNFKSSWDTGFSDNYSFHIGDNIDDLVDGLQNQVNTWGYPFQSGYLTTIFRGMRGSKFMVRSSISGGGKI